MHEGNTNLQNDRGDGGATHAAASNGAYFFEGKNHTTAVNGMMSPSSIFPQFNHGDQTLTANGDRSDTRYSKQAGGQLPYMIGADGRSGDLISDRVQQEAQNEGAYFAQQRHATIQQLNPLIGTAKSILRGDETNLSQSNLSRNNKSQEKDSFSSKKSQNAGSHQNSACNIPSSTTIFNTSSHQDTSTDCVDIDCQDDDGDDDLIQFTCNPISLTEALNFEHLFQQQAPSMPVFGFQMPQLTSYKSLNQNFSTSSTSSSSDPQEEQQYIDVPPLCNMLSYMGSAIEKIKRERRNSESENSSDNEFTGYYQERKNMEFFFKPRDIETHMDFAINGGFAEFNTSNNRSQLSSQCDDAVMEMDVEMIPEADDLLSALMT